MINILITGANSYIGDNLAKWLKNKPNEYAVDVLDVKDSGWQNHDFSKYHVVVNVAGIAHIKETEKNKDLYYKVNRDLAYDIAKKTKNEGVKQFIFLSSMSVYGLDEGIIERDTVLCPKSNYGKSKFEAEQLISNLADEKFAIAIIRPPMVYGNGCKGNYIRLSNFARKVVFFPNLYNKRSMIYIDNLTECIRLLIDGFKNGIFRPQNSEYVNTYNLVCKIRESHNKKTFKLLYINWLFMALSCCSSQFNKVFGNYYYDNGIDSVKPEDYSIVDFDKSIRKTEKL